MKKLIILMLLLMSLLSMPADAGKWISNSSEVVGITNLGGNSHGVPYVFQKDGVWKLIQGEYIGILYGFTWNGTQWVSNSSEVAGVGDIGTYSAPTVFQRDGVWTLIEGGGTGVFYGYTWNGTQWVSNSSEVAGLGDIGADSAPTVFQRDGVWTLISGETFGAWFGYTWNGTQWVSNSSEVAGLTTLSGSSYSGVFQKNGVWTLISGEYNGIFYGYTWNGTQWVSNSSEVAGLGDIGTNSAPTVFQRDGVWTLISGENSGGSYGFNFISYPVQVPTANSVSTGNFYVNFTWNAGAGNVTDSYNVSVNGAWANTTSPYHNSTLTAHSWHNVSVWAFNNSIEMSTTSLSNNTQIPNNIPAMNTIGARSVNEGQWLNFTIGGSDLDTDSLSCATTATKGSLSSCNFNWSISYSDSGVYVWTYYLNDSYGGGDYETITVTVSNMYYIPPVPTVNSVSTGNFYINTTWTAGAGNITNSYNVSVNGAWTNGSANPYHNSTLTAHDWHNVSVWAFNTTDSNLSTTSLTNNTQIPNNPPTPTNTTNQTITELSTVFIDIDNIDPDSDTPTFSNNRTDLFTDFSTTTGKGNWTTNITSAGIYYLDIGVTDGYGGQSNYTMAITVDNLYFIPPVPTINSTITGNFYINTTWTVGAGNITNGYNVTVNGAWSNGSNDYRNTSLSAHAWHNITVWAYNSTNSSLSLASLTNNTQIPNNIPTISNISSAYTTQEGVLLSIYPTSVDADSDTPTFDTTATKGIFTSNNGTLRWTPTSGDNGTYNWEINVTDGYGATSTKQFSVSVNSSTPGMPGNLAAVTGNFYVNYTWTIGVNTDSFNVSQNGTWTNGSLTTYVNNTLTAHNWSNITVYGYNNTLPGVGNSTSLNTQIPNNAPTLGDSSISLVSIYPSTQSTTITVNNVNDTDNDTITVVVGITYLGFETNYTMINTANTSTWTYDFKSGVSGFYTVSAFYATDNYSATTKKTTAHLFEVVTGGTGGTGGGGGGGAPIITPTPIPTPLNQTNVTQSPVDLIVPAGINLKTIKKSSLEDIAVLGIVVVIGGIVFSKRKSGQIVILIGAGVFFFAGYGAGWF